MGELNWGSVADWFTGLLTAGTLFIAVMILWNDRRTKKRASADGFASWQRLMGTRAVKGKANYTVEVHVFNAGDRPIPFVIAIPAPGGKEQWPGVMVSLEPIQPGQQVIQEVGLEESWERTPLLLMFRDGYGKSWVRSLKTGQYVRKREVKQAWKKYGSENPYNMLWDWFVQPKELQAARDGEMKEWKDKPPPPSTVKVERKPIPKRYRRE